MRRKCMKGRMRLTASTTSWEGHSPPAKASLDLLFGKVFALGSEILHLLHRKNIGMAEQEKRAKVSVEAEVLQEAGSVAELHATRWACTDIGYERLDAV